MDCPFLPFPPGNNLFLDVDELDYFPYEIAADLHFLTITLTRKLVYQLYIRIGTYSMRKLINIS